MTGLFHFDHLFSHGEKPHCWYPGIALPAFVLVGHSILHLIHADLWHFLTNGALFKQRDSLIGTVNLELDILKETQAMAELAQEILFNAAELGEVTPLCTHAFFQIFPGLLPSDRADPEHSCIRSWEECNWFPLQTEANSSQSRHLFVESLHPIECPTIINPCESVTS